MQYTTLGNTGLVVSRLSFGAMTFTAGNKGFATVYKTEAEAANAMIGKALDAGVNFFDTADAYAGGESETMDRLREIASGHLVGGGGHGIAGGQKASVAQVAIAWLLAKKAVSSVIVGASKLSQLEDNLAAAELCLSAEEIAALDEQTKPGAVYPNWFSELVVDGAVKEALK